MPSGISLSLDQGDTLAAEQIEDFEPHTLRFYLAHRHGAGSKLRIRTNLELEGNQPPAITAPYD